MILKMLMKKTLVIFWTCFFMSALMAQPASDAQAKAIADKAVAQLQRTPVKIAFTTTYTDARTGAKNVSNGECAVSGKRSYVKYGGLETFFDGKTQWIFMPENNEVSVTEPTMAEQRETNPLLMVRDYAQTHRVGFDEDKAADSHLLCLYPTVAKQTDYFRIKLAVEKKNNRIQSIEFCQRNGDRILLTVRSWQPLPNDFSFVFDTAEHPQVDVNDLR